MSSFYKVNITTKTIVSTNPNEAVLLSIDNTSKSCKFIRRIPESYTNDTTVLWLLNKDKEIYLDSLKFCKKMFNPGYIEMVLHIVSDESIGSIKAYRTSITKALSTRKITLELCDDNGSSMSIAKNFYIFDIIPTVKTSGLYYITIKAYSLDRYLQLNKHSDSHTGKTLSTIFKNSLCNFTFFSNCFLIKLKNAYKKGTSTETIIPYAVQYNESTFDFLSRLAVKYGEFFYYEDNSLYLGLNIVSPLNITPTYSSINFSSNIEESSNRIINNNYLDGLTFGGDSTSKNIVNNESAVDEHLNEYKFLYKEYMDIKDLYSTTGVASSLLNTVLCAPDYTSIASGLIKGHCIAVFTKNTEVSVTNKYYNKRLTTKKGNTIVSIDGIEYNDKSKTTNLSYIANVSVKAKEALAEKISITFNNTISPGVLLGSIITIEGDEFIVVSISSNTSTFNSSNTDIAAQPSIILEIEAIPYNITAIYPHYVGINPIKCCQPQTATIIDNIDPLRLNRVRICYPWQSTVYKAESGYKITSKKRDLTTDLIHSSPWIRVGSPSASSGRGFNFVPEIGDEVMINYENGNIDNPYIDSSLFNSGSTTYKGYTQTNTKSISTKNGQSIILNDGYDGTSFFSDLYSPMNFLTLFSPTLFTGVLGEHGLETLDGSIELTDKYGINKLALDTGGRSISIKSSFGNVKIDAFTGITISAPNGNVKIEGKNISLVAGNNLSLISGNNINGGGLPHNYRELFNAMSDITTEVLSEFIDFSVLRCVIEAFMKPIGGKMLIKSNRFLCLEAGSGKANVINSNFINNNAAVSALTNNSSENNTKFIRTLNNLNLFLTFAGIGFFDSKDSSNPIVSEYNQLYSSLNKTKDAFLYTLELAIRSAVHSDKKPIADKLTKFLEKHLIEFHKITKSTAPLAHPYITRNESDNLARIAIINGPGLRQIINKINRIIEMTNERIIYVREEKGTLLDYAKRTFYNAAIAESKSLYSDIESFLFTFPLKKPCNMLATLASSKSSLVEKKASHYALMLLFIKRATQTSASVGSPWGGDSYKIPGWINGFKIDIPNEVGAFKESSTLSPLQALYITQNWVTIVDDISIVSDNEKSTYKLGYSLLESAIEATGFSKDCIDDKNIVIGKTITPGEILISNRANQTMHITRNSSLQLYKSAELGNPLSRLKRLLLNMGISYNLPQAGAAAPAAAAPAAAPNQ